MRHYIASVLIAVFVPIVAGAASFDYDLYYGMERSPDVSRLQEFLKAQGVYNGPITGGFFGLTREAVRRFQQREAVAPAAGYFGPKTRTRANAMLAGGTITSREKLIADLTAQIRLFQERLTALQSGITPEPSPLPSPSPSAASSPLSTSTAPRFIAQPNISKQGFSSLVLSGERVRLPYEVTVTWKAEDDEMVEEKVDCTPGLTADNGSTILYPAPTTDYSCKVIATDKDGHATVSDVFTFSSPHWFSMGANTAHNPRGEFPSSYTSPLRLGDIEMYNASSSVVHIDQIEVVISDDMNATLNRNRDIDFIVRKGTTSAYDVLSKTTVRTHSDPPKDGPYKYLAKFPVSLTIQPREFRAIGLWVENLEYVTSGMFSVMLDKLQSPEGVKAATGFTFTLKR